MSKIVPRSSSSDLNVTVDGEQTLLAKQVMSEYAGRLTMIERMCQRLRPLRPPVCTSRKLFDYFELPDPYHPLDYNQPYKAEVGSSVLVLGENRRPVAPHAKVPELSPRVEMEKPKPPQAFMPQGVPSAPTRTSNSEPPPPPPPRNIPTKSEFGAAAKHAVTKLPVRPDLQQNTEGGGHAPAQSATAQGRSLPNIPRPQTGGVGGRTGSNASMSGNVRMRRTVISNSSPKVTEFDISSSEEQASSIQDVPQTAPSSSSTPTSTPINRSPSGGVSDGLDDLFGFGAQEGRMRMPRATKQTMTSTIPESKQAKMAEAVRIPPTPIPPANPPASAPTKDVPQEAKQSTVSTSPKQINRSPSGGVSDGLDDLFGFGAQEGRMRMPRASDTATNTKSNRPIFDQNPVLKPDDSKK